MKPINFPGANKILRGPNCNDLPVYNDGHESISLWELDAEELVTIARTGKILLGILAGPSQPPVRLAVLENEVTEIKPEPFGDIDVSE